MFALPRRTALPVGALVLALTLAACGSDADTGTDTGNGDSGGNTAADGGGLSGDIAVDGSYTVTPLTEAAAELVMAENRSEERRGGQTCMTSCGEAGTNVSLGVESRLRS